MTVYAYIAFGDGEEMARQITALSQYGYDELLISVQESQFAGNLKILEKLKAEDVFLVQNLVALNLRTFQLRDFLKQLQILRVDFVFLDENLDSRQENGQKFFRHLVYLCQLDKELMEKHSRLKRGRKRDSGRPRIDESKVERIKYLYKIGEYSLRDIAREVGVSIGTVHKYTVGVPRNISITHPS